MTVEKIVEKAVPVETIVEKIVYKTNYVPELVTAERTKEVLVKEIEIVNAREVINHIQKVP